MSLRLDPLLNELEAAHLIHTAGEPEPAFLFNHVLTQENAYYSLLMKGRRELHLLVAGAFEQEYADRLDDYVPTLAYHYWRAEDWPMAARYARHAGGRAMRVYALREAMSYYAQALDALDRIPNASAEEICDVILAWSEAAFGFVPYPQQLKLLGRAEALARQGGDKRRLALALHTIGKLHIASGYALRAAKSLLECFTLATELGDEKLAVIPTFYMGMATFDSEPRRALAWFDRAVELARKFEDVDTEAYALSAKAMVEGRLGEGAECQRSMEQALQLVPRIRSPMCNSDVHLYSAMAWLDLGDVRHGLEYAKLGVDKAVSADNMECACFGFACLGMGYLQAVEMPQAVHAFEEAIRRSRISGAESAQVLGESGLGMARFFSGEPEGVEEIENALAHARKIGEQYGIALLEQTLGQIYLDRGDLGHAISSLTDALDYYRRNAIRPRMAQTLELLANAFERSGEREQATAARVERSAMEANSQNSPGQS
jgi:tetratricopeptide (TPR) repeat protein